MIADLIKHIREDVFQSPNPEDIENRKISSKKAKEEKLAKLKEEYGHSDICPSCLSNLRDVEMWVEYTTYGSSPVRWKDDPTYGDNWEPGEYNDHDTENGDYHCAKCDEVVVRGENFDVDE